MIVKVQASLAGSHGPSVLIYDETRAIEYETSDAGEVEAIHDLLDGAPKAYHYAKLDEDRRIVLLEPAPDQPW